MFWIRYDNINNFEWGNGWYYVIVKSLEEFGLLIKVVSETVKKEANKEKGGFHGILLGTLSASLLGNL